MIKLTIYLNRQSSLILKFTFILLSSFLAPLLVYAAPDFPGPPDASVEWVGQDVEVNGIKSQVRRFFSDEKIEKVVKFYRKEWRTPIADGLPGFVETMQSPPWYIISRVEDNYLLSVQVQITKDDESTSWGYLSMSPLPDRRALNNVGKNIPKMRNSQVMNEVKSNDEGKKATTLIISSDNSILSNLNFYRNHFDSRRWSLETDQKHNNGVDHSLVYKNGRERVTMIFLKEKNTTKIVINKVKTAKLY